MTPSDLKALLEKASPRPWHYDHENDLVRDSKGLPTFSDDDIEAFVAVMNRADLLIELWEAAGKLRTEPEDYTGIFVALRKLEES